MGYEHDTNDSSNRSNLWIVLIVTLVAGGVAAAMLTGRSISKVSPAASRVAVLPFETEPKGDTALARLGTQLAHAAAAGLANVKDIGTVEWPSVAALAHGAGVPPARAESLAIQLGASSYVHGKIEVEHGRIAAELEMRSTTHGGPSAEILAGGPRADSQLTADSITWAILRRYWRGHHMPQPHADFRP